MPSQSLFTSINIFRPEFTNPDNIICFKLLNIDVVSL
jgi:hypothetical protein